MSLYLVKEVWSYKRDAINGVAGDAWICGLIEAESTERAWDLFTTGEAMQNESLNREDYMIEEVTLQNKERVITRAYGEY